MLSTDITSLVAEPAPNVSGGGGGIPDDNGGGGGIPDDIGGGGGIPDDNGGGGGIPDDIDGGILADEGPDGGGGDPDGEIPTDGRVTTIGRCGDSSSLWMATSEINLSRSSSRCGAERSHFGRTINIAMRK
jgi:hypothetical protein